MTGVQTCALPISPLCSRNVSMESHREAKWCWVSSLTKIVTFLAVPFWSIQLDRKSVAYDWSSDVCSSDLSFMQQERQYGVAQGSKVVLGILINEDSDLFGRALLEHTTPPAPKHNAPHRAKHPCRTVPSRARKAPRKNRVGQNVSNERDRSLTGCLLGPALSKCACRARPRGHPVSAPYGGRTVTNAHFPVNEDGAAGLRNCKLLIWADRPGKSGSVC